MIVIVHSLYFALQYALRWYRRRQLRQSLQVRAPTADTNSPTLPLDPEECFTFPFPVYRQRYARAQDVLLDARWRKDIRKVVDFGCAEFGFFQYLKHLLGVTSVLAVDIDETLLRENAYRVRPLTADYLKQRSDPLTVEILRGSIGDPDWRIKDADAIVGIEIIEHLYPDTLEALPYNIFGYAQPRVAIFTTPNADFNVLFPNFAGFRHADHKFEWTREQFQDWSAHVVTRFPNYTVSVSGVGAGPKGTESLGCCSQMAVFVKTYDVVRSELGSATSADDADDVDDEWRSYGICTHFSFTRAQMALLTDELRPDARYASLELVAYPHYVDDRTPEAKLLHEAVQQIYRHATPHGRYYDAATGVVEIPLYELVTNFEGTFATEAEIKAILQAAEYTVAECALFGTGERCECVVCDVETTMASECDDEPPPPPEEERESSDPLVDSGYQKSLSNAEWSPQSPLNEDVNDIKDAMMRDGGGAGAGASHRRQRSACEADVRSIADVLVRNSLNRLRVDDDDDNEEEEIVENGDVANNNRDGEGNNCPEAAQPPPPAEAELDQRNRNVVVVVVEEVVEQEHLEEEEQELNDASREALFDPNSTSDLLEDGSITDDTDGDVEPPPVAVVAVAEEEESVLPVDNAFPHWLLQLLGGASNVEEEEEQDAADDVDDEAHFYCQGDGLVEAIDDDDDDNEGGGGEETSTGSSATDAAVAERTLSENDVRSLPVDAVVAVGRALRTAGAAAARDHTSSSVSQDSAGEEYYDTLGDADPDAQR